MTTSEQQILMMISSAGDSRAKALEALRSAGSGNYEEARVLLDEARKADLEAHHVQTELITSELQGDPENRPAMTLLMAHAQDHYMSAQLARDLIEELISVFEKRDAR